MRSAAPRGSTAVTRHGSYDRHVSDVEGLLESTETVLVVDWPSTDVPESLARAGFTVIVRGGPGPTDYTSYRLENGDIVRRPAAGPPQRADIVYSHRPVEELPAVVETARALGARAVWIQSGVTASGERHPEGCWMPPETVARARALVETAGMVCIEEPYIGAVARRVPPRQGSRP